MNVKTVCQMIYRPEDGAATIRIGFNGDLVSEFELLNLFQVEAYGRFRVSSFRALGVDTYEIIVASTEVKPIEE